MTENPSTWRHVRAILQLPFVVTVVVPACLLLLRPGSGPRSWMSWPVGTTLLLAGLLIIASTVRLLGRLGGGTLAPWDPTARLVVAGPYCHVRNPMITGVFGVLLGEAVLFGSAALFLWFGGFVIGNLLYIRFSEEPGLRRRFGADYDVYADNVPAWIPRLTAWHLPA